MSGQAPTPEQRRAAEPGRSVWVDANAGTGKTRVLADRVLRLLLSGVPPETLLCLTFTKAAAGEMSQRVMQRLAAWAPLEDEALAAELLLLDGVAADSRRLAMARGLHDAVLALPQGLAITTVHGLCQQLLKRFPLEAGVAPGFEIIDERSAQELLALARESVLAAGRRDDGLATDLERLSRVAADQTILAAVDALVAERKDWVPARDRAGGLAGATLRLAAILDVDPTVDDGALQLEAAEDDPERDAGLQAAATALGERDAASQRAAANAVERWLAAAPAARVVMLEAYRGSFCTFDEKAEPVGWRVSGKLVNAKLRRELPDVVAVLEAEADRLDALDRRCRASRVFEQTTALWRVADRVLRAFEAAKRNRAALDFDDLLLRGTALLAEPGSGAWVRYKLDHAIAHVLVDEAQDTSPLQWRLVEQLLDEHFVGEGARPAGSRTLFVVGDAKQSIYRFQGADPESTAKVRERLESRATAAGEPIDAVELETSFRSSQAVLDVVDAMLAEPAFRPVTAGPPRHRAFLASAAGKVDLWPLVPPAEAAEAGSPWEAPPRTATVDPAERRLAKAIARTVADWLDGGERLLREGRVLTAGDVMVLLRRRGPLQEVLVRAFKRASVPVMGADRLPLTSHLAVQDLVNLGEAVLLPENDFAFACFLKSPLGGLDDDDLFRLAHGRGKGERLLNRLRDAAGGDARLAQILDRFETWRRLADFVPPYEFYLRALGGSVGPGGFEGRRAFIGRFGAEAGEPLDAFVDQALAYERGHAATLQGFLHWLGEGEQTLKRELTAAADGVRVMTVHGAKGLEAPVVFLADAGPRGDAHQGPLLWTSGVEGLPCWRPPKRRSVPVLDDARAVEVRQRKEDDLRLLYVAATRAAERLVVCGWQPRRANPESCWHSRFGEALAGLTATSKEPPPVRLGVEGERLVYATGLSAEPAAPSQAAVLPDPLPAALLNPAPPLHRPSRLAPSETTAVGAGDGAAEARATALAVGSHVHRLLELLPGRAPAARAEAMRRYLDEAAADLEATTRERITQDVERVLFSPELEPLFTPGSLAEQSIVGRLGKTEVAGQIDRIAVVGDRVWVADFKTGLPPSSGAPVPPPLVRQMALYAALVGRVHPQKSVRCALVWTRTGEVSWLDDTMLTTALPQV
ncbi:MAG: double-strand break repair helicase AddA [Pseudomonadota bacterium]